MCHIVHPMCNNVRRRVRNACHIVHPMCNNVRRRVRNACHIVHPMCNNVRRRVPTCYTEKEIELELETEKQPEQKPGKPQRRQQRQKIESIPLTSGALAGTIHSEPLRILSYGLVLSQRALADRNAAQDQIRYAFFGKWFSSSKKAKTRTSF